MKLPGLVMVKRPYQLGFDRLWAGLKHGHDADCLCREGLVYKFLPATFMLVIPVLNPRLDRQFLVI
jgi:hypothetical protein